MTPHDKRETIDVLLIQPPVMRPLPVEEADIAAYFDVLSKVGDFLGDAPTEPNLGLLFIAAQAQKQFRHIRVRILDLNVLERKIRNAHGRPIAEADMENEIGKYQARVVGLSFMTSSYGLWGKRLSRICKRLNPDSYVFLGGIHPTVRYREVLSECGDAVDGVLVGQGEYAFCELLEAVLFKPRPIEELRFMYTPGSKRSHVDRIQLTNEQLATLPTPAYNLLPKDCFPVTVRFYTERGCPGHCSFCSVGEFFKGHTTSAVPVDIRTCLQYVKATLEDLDVDHFVIGDLSLFNNSLEDRRFVEELAAVCKGKGFDSNWWCQSRGDLLTSETIAVLKDAGCRQVAVGCEGGTDRQLKRIGKRENCAQVKSSLERLRSAGIDTQCYWIIGLPGDSLEDVRQTQKTILEYLESGLMTLPHVSVLVPFPNTPAFKQAKLNGIRILHNEWSRYWMNCDPFGCDVPAYCTVDTQGRVLLSANDIYELWLETISQIREYYERGSVHCGGRGDLCSLE